MQDLEVGLRLQPPSRQSFLVIPMRGRRGGLLLPTTPFNSGTSHGINCIKYIIRLHLRLLLKSWIEDVVCDVLNQKYTFEL